MERAKMNIKIALFVMAVAFHAVRVESGSCDRTKPGDCVQCSTFNSPCFATILQCPESCPTQIPADPSTVKGCFVDCDTGCTAVCKNYVPNCNDTSAVCYDPRFIGGDGIMFYFHGKTNQDFAIVSDHNLQINAHFIGKRPEGRTRDYTWVQSLGIMFGTHALTVGAKKVSKWDDNVDQFFFSFDGKSISVPQGSRPRWEAPAGEVTVQRNAKANGAVILLPGLVEIFLKVVPITAEDNRVHNYQIPVDDCFAHLEVRFNFFSLSGDVDGVLGQTYRPGFKNPVKVGVPMPIMGGENKYRTSSLIAADCKFCLFKGESGGSSESLVIKSAARLDCTGKAGKGSGIFCRR